ncbi:hypothetical protein FGLOB1_8134 [Fusarium globosum]|uniref:Uncharacterized protein n=1 Tax=Fusarium globosum TaxID=78864 RepID=A0A8H6D5W0_9HYPO|nr:hypothetical protein FGLOB1_8134 [Fusarium globosum]
MIVQLLHLPNSSQTIAQEIQATSHMRASNITRLVTSQGTTWFTHHLDNLLRRRYKHPPLLSTIVFETKRRNGEHQHLNGRCQHTLASTYDKTKLTMFLFVARQGNGRLVEKPGRRTRKRTTGPGGPGGGEVNCIPTALVQKLAAKEAESYSIEDLFAAAVKRKQEAKPEETKPEETEAEEERYRQYLSHIFRIVSLTLQTMAQKIQATSNGKPSISSARAVKSPPVQTQTFTFHTVNTSNAMAPKRPEIKFSSVPLAQRITSMCSDTNMLTAFPQSRKAVRTTPSSTEHIKILEGMGF